MHLTTYLACDCNPRVRCDRLMPRGSKHTERLHSHSRGIVSSVMMQLNRIWCKVEACIPACLQLAHKTQARTSLQMMMV